MKDYVEKTLKKITAIDTLLDLTERIKMSELNSHSFDDRLLTNFSIEYLAIYQESIQEALRLGLLNADKLIIDGTAIDRDGIILKDYCALKVNCPKYLVKDLSEFWMLFRNIRKKHGFKDDYQEIKNDLF